ncbi:ABC-type multidrug transport system fused ATPase/permease subunit [Paenibacillus pabuli]|uniref:ABC-type multidrug transport system fused ATPase/permease subunit n=1 Tax=Paenibacillus pabuli TaxID=1472 RepID=A0ABX9BEP8_9BACL|nr:ABC transporter ATP-binding protein [Paenibacillus pabuli]RAI89554.1 ABC-type multidrug transport system fused ATPase/permease subunit [Paenibacillus pabuli]
MGYLKWAFQYCRKIKIGYIIAILFVIIEASSSTAVVYLQKYMIDSVFVSANYRMFAFFLLLFSVAAVLHSIMFSLSSFVAIRNEYHITKQIVLTLLEKIRHMPINAIHSSRTGEYIQNLTTNATQAGNVLGWQIPRALQEASQLMLITIILGAISPVFLMFIFLISIVYLYIGRHFAQRLKEARNHVLSSKKDLIIRMEEGISSTREVIAYHRMSWERKIYDLLFQKYFQNVIKEGKILNKQMMFTDPLKWIVSLSVLGLGGIQTFNGDMSIGTLVIFLQFSSQFTEIFTGLFQSIMKVSGDMASIDKIQALEGSSEIIYGNRSIKGPIATLGLMNIFFTYGENKTVLKNLNIEFPIGKKIGLVGESGGGKSTIIHLFCRYYEPTDGQIYVNDIPLNQISMEEWSSRVAIVPQDPYLFSDTIRENILMGRNFSDEEIIKVCQIAKIHNFICGLQNGYETNVGERGVKLSGGQRQRIAIARALLGNPELLLMDEATSALDIDTEKQILSGLQLLRESKTTIMVAHRLSTIIDSDNIFVINQGELVESGRHQELISNEKAYYKLICPQGS